MFKKIRNKLSLLGPSLLWASAAIGVSHIVQSTRAGATYGYALIVVVVLANVLKYPFFEFATRYTVVKNETVLDGYKKIGNWAIYLYIALTLGTMFTIQAGVTLVTAAIFENWLNLDLGLFLSSLMILLSCILIIKLVKSNFFIKFIKSLILVLILSTVASAILTTNVEADVASDFLAPEILSYVGITFVIALVGWMPSPIDLSAWSSVWIMERRNANSNFTLRDNTFDFNFSYLTTTILAVIFLVLGANVFYGSNVEFGATASGFVNQLVELYSSLGSGARNLILLSAFSAMFSTTITCLDAFPKVLSKCSELVLNERKSKDLLLIIVVVGTLLLIQYFSTEMRRLVDLATILSFLTSPFLAYLNYRLIYASDFPVDSRPHFLIKTLALLGIWFLVIFSFLFVANKIGLIF
ncbi:divalent metal cation transporter [bacterium]|jgi:Mn2+/Fe2+ NRAMP family transporter|nr:divalent metal cation transporter [bacterium]MBT3795842.1 divalent metal cation transporter [bacterium]MBT4634360.1 divalent metal cation transporter [bacterium]